MKTKAQINAAFDASLRATLSLTDKDQQAAASHYRDMAELLAWVLDFRDYPGFDRTDRFFNRLISADEQAISDSN